MKLSLDALLFPEVKAAENQEAKLAEISQKLQNGTVTKVGRHGKYFWIRFRKPEGPLVMLMHFGMTGMIKLRGIELHLIMMENGGDKTYFANGKTEQGVSNKEEALFGNGDSEIAKEFAIHDPTVVKVEKDIEIDLNTGVEHTEKILTTGKPGKTDNNTDWPPKFTKFELVFEDQTGTRTLDFAFSDPRRLGRVRFLDDPKVATDEGLMETAPLNVLGPDYSKTSIPPTNYEFVFGDPDPDHHGRPRLLLEEFRSLIFRKKKPIKLLLLDQDQFAGIGNWVSDEILYHARIHPGEVLSLKIEDPNSDVIKQLYELIIYIMEYSVKVEGDAHKFPENWLMLYRWSKGRKTRKKTVEGYTVDFETIGGRTSCFVPEVQKRIRGDGRGRPPKRECENAGSDAKKKKKKTKEPTLELVQPDTPHVRPQRNVSRKSMKESLSEEDDESDEEAEDSAVEFANQNLVFDD